MSALRPGLLLTVWLAACAEDVVITAPEDAAADIAAVQNDLTAALDADAAVPDAADVTMAAPDVAVQPCVEAMPTVVDFGTVGVGAMLHKQVALHNCGTVPVCVQAVGLTKPSAAMTPFALHADSLAAMCTPLPPGTKPTPAAPCCVAAGQTAQVDVSYAPTSSAALDTEQLNVDTTDPQHAHIHVALRGIGAAPKCAVAAISVQEPDVVIPQTLLHLSGAASLAPANSQIDQWQWTVTQPSGSTQVFSPNNATSDVTFSPNVAGEYTFCVKVIDSLGAASCNTACTSVLAVPTAALHIELLWETPTDLDQSDTGPEMGADVDLHFASQLADGPDIDCDAKPDPWFNSPFDCFWFNETPSWGLMDPAVPDDPRLDLDDTDGAGPENLNLEQPQGQAVLPFRYAVGVHYWNDHGFGTSYATLTVFLSGTPTVKFDKVKLEPLDMWYVGKLKWPSGQLELCHQTGNMCAANGAMWQSKGDWCITPCYVNELFTAAVGGSSPATCAGP